MKIFLGLTVFFFTLLTFLVVGGFLYGYTVWSGPGKLDGTKTVIIARGSGVNGIAETLYREGVIDNPAVFKIAARLTGEQGRFKAGEYEFPAGISMRAAMMKIVSGDVMLRRITIPEGWTSWQIVQELNAAPHLTGTVTAIPAEGSLLPDTYLHNSETDRAGLIAEMEKAMTDTLQTLWPQREDSLPFSTMEEAVILASIVEKETGIAAERPRIAGVFINRLRAGMPLQTDPTVIYALTKGEIKADGMGPLGRRLLKKDLLETDSPYNTYKYPGLPPGPIANPGREAIEAVLHPEDHNFFYFVADGTGGHIFAATLAEHNANAAKWRKLRKEQGN